MPYEFPSVVVSAVNALNSEIADQRDVVQECHGAVSRARRNLSAAEEKARDLNHRAALLHTLAVVERGLPMAVRVLCEEIATHEADAANIDRTGRQQAESRRLAKEARAQLKKICPHTFLYNEVRHEPFDPEDDASPGHMHCLICDFSEEEAAWFHHSQTESYAVTNDPDRLRTHYLGPKENFSENQRPYPWERIRSFFLTDGVRKAAASIGYELK